MNYKKGKPIYKQITYDIVYRIYNKEIKCATILDSVRELSLTYNVTPKTIQTVTKYLDELGIITRKPGVGSIITNDIDRVNAVYYQHGLEYTREYVDFMKKLGYDMATMIKLIKDYEGERNDD